MTAPSVHLRIDEAYVELMNAPIEVGT